GEGEGAEGEGEGAEGEGEGEGAEGEGEGAEGEGEGAEGEGEGSPPRCGACPDDGRTYIDVQGRVNILHHGSGGPAAEVHLAAAEHWDSFSEASPEVIQSTSAIQAEGYGFELCCLDVTERPEGIAVILDDRPPDGPAGTHFPTSTLVATRNPQAQWVDVAGALPRSLTTTLVSELSALVEVDLTESNFVMGVVVNDQGQPVSGVTVVDTNGMNNGRFVYPSSDFTTLGESTALHGLWLVPHSPGLGDYIVQSRTSTQQPASGLPGRCVFVVLQLE
ncbi:MAG: hypothetical protein RBU45_11205, partial [Myxococcota bacterium]|nr:hypothetical protein [Myxococcota bacterium]